MWGLDRGSGRHKRTCYVLVAVAHARVNCEQLRCNMLPWVLALPDESAGTLTQNKLSLNDPILIGDMNAEELVFYAALASKRDGGQDAIDFCICQAAKGAGAE